MIHILRMRLQILHRLKGEELSNFPSLGNTTFRVWYKDVLQLLFIYFIIVTCIYFTLTINTANIKNTQPSIGLISQLSNRGHLVVNTPSCVIKVTRIQSYRKMPFSISQFCNTA